MLRKIVTVVGLLVAALLVVVAMQPAEFRIERSTVIEAPPEVAFAHVNDLHRWTGWSPWENRDPDLKREYSAPAAGKGATYRWSGNDDVGEGRMTNTHSEPPQHVGLDLEFIKPFPANNQVTFRFEPAPSGTLVSWSMTGVNGFVGKLFSMLMDIDEMVGKDFEAGLRELKRISENASD